ncbi:MAG: hypothetical protein FWC16_00515 [Defluviitaleaceae bacterium]|nr:hypothetical protein [Defluviitaleaceae bacterium]MCL2273386.1 hypothetical protein [Defluviitaleaceae bacterium]
MYELLSSPKIFSKAEIDQEFNGKWVYIVKAKFTPNDMLIEGMPVVTGDAPFDGVDDGIYNQFDEDEYEETCSYTLLKQPNLISSVYNVK